MTDKIAELTRINGPRVDKVVAMLGLIEKSANSLRAHELDVAQLLSPVRATLDQITDPMAVEMIDEPAREAQRDVVRKSVESEMVAVHPSAYMTPPIAREASRFEDMSTQQLVDVMIACGALLAERRQ